MVIANPKSRKLPSQPLLHKKVFYWPDRRSADAARQGIVDQYPNARIVEYLRGYAVQIYKSGPYLPLEEGELQHRFASPGDVMHRNPRTRDIDLYVNDYGSAMRFLRGKSERKLANNTFVRQEDESSVSVVLHRTPVVTYYRTGLIQLRSGGYRSKTTAQRINQLLPPGWKLSRWVLIAPDGEKQDFFDGIAIHAGLRTHGASSRTPEHQPHPGPSVPKWYKNPGKFSDTIEELCYHNPDQELGESDGFGWYGLVSGFLLPDARELAASDNVDSDEFESDAEEYDWPLNAIISEDSQGFIRMETYKNNRDAMREWHKLEQDYETFSS